MNGELSKIYDPAAVEAEAYRIWLDEKCFAADPAKGGASYCIVIPPPNVTGALHLGHAINDTLQDILTRVHRMRGFNALWVPGIDHAGIATQAVVEKQLKEKEHKTRHDIGRQELVKRIWAWKDQYGNRILEQLKRLGCSCDWDRTRFTLDDQCARAVRETFFKMFKEGLVYRGKRLVNWDIHLQTSISDDEIYHETVKTSLWHIKYPIEGADRFMVVATTRPETMLGDTAVAVHSQDARWNWAIGKQVRLPLTDRLIPIIADDILVDPKFGTGCVKVTPAHDPNDYAVWQRHQGAADQISLINILNPDGTLNGNAGPYAKMQRQVARKKVVEDLTAQGLLVKEEPYETQVGHSDRSKTPIEPYLSDQWFIKMADLAEPALEAVRNGTIKFFPERHAQQYLAWLGEKRDWPISRQLWWGHRIPVWHHPSPKPDALQWLRVHQDLLHVTESENGAFVCLRQSDPSMESRMELFGFVEDPDVLDTWFSSALWPHSTLGWPEQTAELKKYYPTRVLVTARDIITLWVARMVMAGLYNMGEVPFHHVAINPTILDGKGERMSKSKGNGVDPVDIIETHGADALRFTLTLMATETQDARLPVKKDAAGRNTSDKFDIGRNFANKLWNAARFALANLENAAPQPAESGGLSLPQRWILSRFNRAVQEADAALEVYRFDQYAKTCYDFFWRDFCDWYVEAIKPSLKESAAAGQAAGVLAAVLDGALRLMHPMIPFITEAIWTQLNQVCPQRGLPEHLQCPASKRLIAAAWPRAGRLDEEAENRFAQIQEIVGAIRNARNEHKVDPRKVLAVYVCDHANEVLPHAQLVNLLAGCELKEAGDDWKTAAADKAPRLTIARHEFWIDGLFDPAAQSHLLEKQREELSRTIATLQGRLANAGYIAKAPAHLVEQTRTQLAQAQAELAKLP
jgi:valyl-tRNA synthetase